MRKQIKVLFKNKVFNISLLSFLWLVLTVLYIVTFDTSFSIWSYNHKNNDIKNLNYKPFYKGERFKGEFTAQDDNLGIFAIRFQTYIRPPYSLEDQYLFHIKEKGSSNWYYENIYRSGLVYDVPFFPFGFPQITDSKGKIYDFEIITLNTNSVNQLSISNKFPIFQTKYKYSGPQLIRQPKQMFEFLWLKFSNAFKTPDVIFSSFIYLLPLLFFLAWISFLSNLAKPITDRIIIRIKHDYKFPGASYFKLDLFLVLIVSLDVLFFQLLNDTVYLVILWLWIVTLNVYKKKSKYSFIIGLFLIALCPIFLFVKMEPTAEKSAAWAYMFFLAGTIQILREK